MAQTLCNFDKRSTSKWNFSDLSLLTLKSIKFFMPFLQPRVSFTSNFAPLFSVMRYHSSVLFHVKRYMLWTKGTHKSANFQIFDCSREISGNYDRRLFSAEKCRGFMSHDDEEWCKNWRKTDLLFQKWLEFGEFWPEHSKVSKIALWLVCFVQSI